DKLIEVHGGGDLRPGGNLGALELRASRGIAGHDLSAQLVHHLGRKPGNGRVLPGAALLLEFLAERRNRRPITACRPLRNHGQARLHRLGASETRGGDEAGGTGEHGAATDLVHWLLPSFRKKRDRRGLYGALPPSSTSRALTSFSEPNDRAGPNVDG